MRIQFGVFLLAVGLLAGVACGGSSDSPASSLSVTVEVPPSPARTAAEGTVGIVAIGHSGLTGANSDPARPGQAAKENSWATGTSPAVNSVYMRLVAAQPQAEGKVYNAAEAGSRADALQDQASVALSEVPTPALVIIMTIDNDIRCDGTDDARIDGFGEDISRAIEYITTASPASQILIGSFLGDPATFAAAIAAEPELTSQVNGDGTCDFFDAAGNPAPQNVAAYSAIVANYMAEQRRICGTFPQCHDDAGTLTRYVETLEGLSDDLHLSVLGHARVAELIWPTVAALLELE